MQRLYRALLLIGIAVGIAACLRPGAAGAQSPVANYPAPPDSEEVEVSDIQTPSYQPPPQRYPAPTAQPQFQAAVQPAPTAGGEADSRAVPCESAQIVARVGSKVILAGELLAPINEILAKHKDKIPPSQMELQRRYLMQELLKSRIEIKLIYFDAERSIPAENLDKFKEKLNEQFEAVEIPRRIKEAKVQDRQELEERMLAVGTSLDREKRVFAERIIAQQWLQQQAVANEEISHEEMLAYYQEHQADFERPARARWEQLMVRKSGHPDPAEARAMLARMGNEVIRGKPFAEVAKASSQGTTASQGGLRDWTTQGSLVSESLDQALFGLPLGQLSQILEDAQGFHIIRVIEREKASRTPFSEAQVEIRKKIRQQREKDARDKYLAKLRAEIPIWTIFEGDRSKTEEPFTASSRFLQR